MNAVIEERRVGRRAGERRNLDSRLIDALAGYAERNSMSDSEIAAAIGVVPSMYLAIRGGQRSIKQLPIEKIQLIANLLGISCSTAIAMSERE